MIMSIPFPVFMQSITVHVCFADYSKNMCCWHTKTAMAIEITIAV